MAKHSHHSALADTQQLHCTGEKRNQLQERKRIRHTQHTVCQGRKEKLSASVYEKKYKFYYSSSSTIEDPFFFLRLCLSPAIHYLCKLVLTVRKTTASSSTFFP